MRHLRPHVFSSYDLLLRSKMHGNAWAGSSRGWNQVTSNCETSLVPKLYSDTRTEQTNYLCWVSILAAQCKPSLRTVMTPSFLWILFMCFFQRFWFLLMEFAFLSFKKKILKLILNWLLPPSTFLSFYTSLYLTSDISVCMKQNA